MGDLPGQDAEWTTDEQQPYNNQPQVTYQSEWRVGSPVDSSNIFSNNPGVTPRWLPHQYSADTSNAPLAANTRSYIYGPSLPAPPNHGTPQFTSYNVPSSSPGAYQPSQHVTFMRTHQTSQGNVPYTDNTSTSVHFSCQQDIVDEQKLYESFKRHLRPKKFFAFGKVFLTLWVEPAGGSTSSVGSVITSAVSRGRYGEPIFSKIRRFIVVREGPDSCTALAIKTYNGEGVAKKNVRKCEHAIIFTGKTAPLAKENEGPARGEKPLLPQAIRIDGDDPGQKLDEMSRVDFGKVYTIEHNVKVRSMGKLNRASEQALRYQLEMVWSNTVGVSLSRTSENKRLGSGSSERHGYLEAYNTLLAAGWTSAQAEKVLKSHVRPGQEQLNNAPTDESNIRMEVIPSTGPNSERCRVSSE